MPAPRDPMPASRPWFVVVPSSWRNALVTPIGKAFAIDDHRVAFAVTRSITALLSAAIALSSFDDACAGSESL